MRDRDRGDRLAGYRLYQFRDAPCRPRRTTSIDQDQTPPLLDDLDIADGLELERLALMDRPYPWSYALDRLKRSRRCGQSGLGERQ
jgi:hypothetical protein